MKGIIINVVEISILIVILIIFLFLFVDCKMENVQLSTRYEVLHKKVSDLEKELAGVRQVYSLTLITSMQNHGISLEEFKAQLPEYEYEHLQKVLLSKEHSADR